MKINQIARIRNESNARMFNLVDHFLSQTKSQIQVQQEKNGIFDIFEKKKRFALLSVLMKRRAALNKKHQIQRKNR